MAKHAFLSASASHRWINCPPSAKLCESIRDESSPYAKEGTDCHELCAYLVEKALGKEVTDPTGNLTYYNGEMQNCAEEYCSYVLEQYEKAKEYCSDPMIFIEQRLDSPAGQKMDLEPVTASLSLMKCFTLSTTSMALASWQKVKATPK